LSIERLSYAGSLLLELKILQHEVIKNLKFKPAGTVRRVDWYLRLFIYHRRLEYTATKMWEHQILMFFWPCIIV